MNDDQLACPTATDSEGPLALLDATADEQPLHLSTLLCGAHRRDVIETIRSRLKEKRTCRVISTQVVEAGVDLDFPVVLRALGPLDSIVQAAGRCNREGNLDRGQVFIFDPAEGGFPFSDDYKIRTNGTRRAIGLGIEDPNQPEVMENYFKFVFDSFGRDGFDKDHVQESRKALDFPKVSEKFRMIEDQTESIVIGNYGLEAERQKVGSLLKRIRSDDPERRLLLRQLQPFIVNVFSQKIPELEGQGLLSEITDGLWEWKGQYDLIAGIGRATRMDPERLVF